MNTERTMAAMDVEVVDQAMNELHALPTQRFSFRAWVRAAIAKFLHGDPLSGRL